MVEISLETVELLLLSTGLLLLVLVVSLLSRPLIFTQYLHHMTGIRLSPRVVSRVFKTRGRAGVRDLFLDLIIREDLKDGPRITPDTPPDREILAPPEET